MEGSVSQENTKKQLEEAQNAMQIDAQIKGVMARILESSAYDRLMNVKMSNQELYTKTVNSLVYMYKKLGRKITEKELVTLLSASVEKRTGSLEIRRK